MSSHSHTPTLTHTPFEELSKSMSKSERASLHFEMCSKIRIKIKTSGKMTHYLKRW